MLFNGDLSASEWGYCRLIYMTTKHPLKRLQWVLKRDCQKSIFSTLGDQLSCDLGEDKKDNNNLSIIPPIVTIVNYSILIEGSFLVSSCSGYLSNYR